MRLVRNKELTDSCLAPGLVIANNQRAVFVVCALLSERFGQVAAGS